MRLAFFAMRDASTTISRARTDQYTRVFPSVEEAWTRLGLIARVLKRVRRQVDVYMSFVGRLYSHQNDIASIEMSTLERSMSSMQKCRQRMVVIFDRLRRWKLPDDGASQPSDGAMAACAAGMADEILHLADDISYVLTVFLTAVVFTVPSQSESTVTPASDMRVTGVPDTNNSSHFTTETFEQSRLLSGSDNGQRISTGLTENGDHFRSSSQLRSNDSSSGTLYNTGIPERVSDIERLIVVAPNDAAVDDRTPQSETEVKFASMLSTEGRQRRTRITDLGTIDLDPAVSDDTSVAFPSGVSDSGPMSVSVEDVFVAPAINLASENNFGLDLFVQFSCPSGQSAGNDGSDANVEAPMVGLGSSMVTRSSETAAVRSSASSDLDFKPLSSLLSYDLEWQDKPEVFSPSTVSHGAEYYNLVDSKTESDFVDLCSWPVEEPVEVKPDHSLLDVRWHEPDDSIRFSLPSTLLSSAPPRQEVPKVEELPVSHSNDVVFGVAGNKGDVLSSDQVVVIDDYDDDSDESPCCQILEVYSLPPDEESDLSGQVPALDGTDLHHAANHALEQTTEVANRTVDASCQTTSIEEESVPDSCTKDVEDEGSLPFSHFVEQVSNGKPDGPLVKKRRGRPPGRRASSDDASGKNQYKMKSKKIFSNTSPGRTDRTESSESADSYTVLFDPVSNSDEAGCDIVSSTKVSDSVQQRKDNAITPQECQSAIAAGYPREEGNSVDDSLPPIFAQKVIDRPTKYDDPRVKRKPGRPPIHGRYSKAVLSSSISRETKSDKKESISELSTNNSRTKTVSFDVISSSKKCNKRHTTYSVSRETCHSTTSGTRNCPDGEDKDDTVMFAEHVNNDKLDGPPAKRKRGRPPSRRLNSSPSVADATGNSKDRKKSDNIFRHSPPTFTGKSMSSKSTNPYSMLFEPDPVIRREGAIKQTRPGVGFYQPGVVNIAQSLVDGRSIPVNAVASGGFGLASEWKPAIAKKGLEKEKPASTSALVDSDCQPSSTGVTECQSEKQEVHSSVSCIEMGEQWADVQPVSPCDRTSAFGPPQPQRSVRTDLRVFENVSDDEEPTTDDELEQTRQLMIDLGDNGQEQIQKSAGDDKAAEHTAHLSPRSATDVRHTWRDVKHKGSSLKFNTGLTASDLVDSGSNNCERTSKAPVRHHRGTDNSSNSEISTSSPKIQSLSKKATRSPEQLWSSRHHQWKTRHPFGSDSHRTTQYFMDMWENATLEEQVEVVDGWKDKLQNTEKRTASKLCRRDENLREQPECRSPEMEEKEPKRVRAAIVC